MQPRRTRGSAAPPKVRGQVGKGADIPVDILHMKIAHKKLWGRANEIIAMVQKARDEGRTVTSAGISAGIDMSLHLVERLAGRELAERTARQMDFDWRENS